MDVHESVLGLDTSWTSSGSSGVALIARSKEGRWIYVESAPGYQSFINRANGHPVRWNKRHSSGAPSPELLRAADKLLGGAPVSVVAIDMPMSTRNISGRRAADNMVSSEFSKYWCGTHSPTPNRPGKLSAKLRQDLEGHGYELAVDGNPSAMKMIEVYPHPAIVTLLGLDRRLPYKVDRRGRYWRGESLTAPEKKNRLIKAFRRIQRGLAREIDYLPDFLPSSPYAGTYRSLKPFEDTIDALVCAWVGACYLEGRSVAFGDCRTNAIWVPVPRKRRPD